MLAVWSGVASGLCIVLTGMVEAVTGETAPTSFVLGLSPALALPLLVALHLRQRDVTGDAAYTLNLVGLGLFGGAAFTLNMALFHLDEPVLQELLRGPTMFALLGSAVVFAIGTVLFGVTMLRARIHPRVPIVAYMVAFPLLAVASRLSDTPLTSAVHVVAGVSLVWLAAGMVRQPLRTS